MYTPQAIGRVGGGNLANAGQLKQMDATPTAVLNLYIGSFLVGADSALKVMDDAAASVSYVCVGLYESDGVTPVKKGYVTNAELDAGWTGFVRVMPIGDVIFVGEEDGDGGNISNANAGPGIYTDLMVAEPSAQELAIGNKTLGVEQPMPSIKIDSSAVNASSSGLLIELLGLESTPDQPADGTGHARKFRFKVISSAATYSQSANT